MRTKVCLLVVLLCTNLSAQEYSGDPLPKPPPLPATVGKSVLQAKVETSQPTKPAAIRDSPRTGALPQVRVRSLAIEPIRQDDGRGQLGKCEPVWTKPKDLKLEGQAVTVLTHFTRRLDTELKTRPAMQKLVEISKASEVPVVYLQESKDAKLYFYDDCVPTAYVKSDLGHLKLSNPQLEHVVLAGGLYELCFNNTFHDVLKNWSEVREDKILKITLVLDAIYGVGSDSYAQDEFDGDLRDWMREQPTPTLLMSSLMNRLEERDHAWTFLSRKWRAIPEEFGLYVSYRGELTAIRFASENYPTIRLEYTTMEEGFKFDHLEPKPYVIQVDSTSDDSAADDSAADDLVAESLGK